MKRNTEALKGDLFDVVIMGAGIHGATTAFFLSHCDVRVLLLDQNDFCSATSANSLKIIHGGLRYLQHMNLKRMRESVSSRRWILKNFPAIVRPLECLMPTHGHGMRGRITMSAALALNNVISSDQNKEVPAGQYLGWGHVKSKQECQAAIPGLDGSAITGAAAWFDALAVSTERVVLSLVNAAWDNGVTTVNNLKARKLNAGNGSSSPHEILCQDEVTGKEVKVKGKCILNMTGPWLDQFPQLQRGISDSCQGFASAVNIVVRKKFFGEYAVGLEGTADFQDQDALLQKGKRLFFFVPWRDYTMIGTVYSLHRDNEKEYFPRKKDIERIVEEINRIYPAAEIGFNDVTFYHAGLVPLVHPELARGFDVQLDKHESVVDHGKTDGLNNIFSLKSVKYTTAKSVASSIGGVLRKQGIIPEQVSVEVSDLPELPATFHALLDSSDTHLLKRYGRDFFRLEEYLENESMQDISVPGFPLFEAEIHYAVQQEMALHLDDLFFRRTDLATASCPPLTLLNKSSEIMGKLLNWDQERCGMEVQRVLNRFNPLQIDS